MTTGVVGAIWVPAGTSCATAGTIVVCTYCC